MIVSRRVAHVLPWTEIGGTEVGTLRIAEAVARAGYESVMLCRDDADAVQDFFRQRGYETHAYDASQFDANTGSGFIRGTAQLAHLLRKARIDLVHFADVPAGHKAVGAARLLGKRTICHVRNRYPWLTPGERASLVAMDRLVFVSEHTRRNFGRTARFMNAIKSGRSTVIYDGIAVTPADPEDARRRLLQSLRLPTGTRLIGMVARISPQKDHLTLVKAAERVVVRHRDARFLLIGGCGSESGERVHREVLSKALSESAAGPHFVDLGFRSDVQQLIPALDVFVLATHFEGLPLVILEAMAHGRPVVATAVDGIPEIVAHEKTGLLHDHEDADQLAERLERLLDSRDLARHFGQAGQASVKERFSTERFAADMVCLYDQVLGIRGRQDPAFAR